MVSNAFDISKFNFSDKRKDLSFMARVAETAERYDDMCQFMRELVKSTNNSDLTVEERNLLSVAYKNVIGTRRAAWRTLNIEENKNNELVNTYKVMLEAEMENICKDVLNLLETVLVPLHSRQTQRIASLLSEDDW